MNKIALPALIIGLIVAAIVVNLFVFTVSEREQGIVVRVGDPVRVEDNAGLKMKLPIENVVFLDKRNGLFRDEVQQTGTVDHTPVYPREVAKRALALDATAVILVHNHPSGDPKPSQPDIEIRMRG